MSTIVWPMENLQTSMPLSLSSVTGNLTNRSRPPVNSDIWSVAEQRTQEILCAIQPAVASEKKRETIIKYVRDLLKQHFGAEVLAFGSVPLRTYLPDGDIDLTALVHPNMEETLAMDICRVLQSEEDRDFQVKNIHYIQAQVKVVKCCVNDISVDISFNQMAGLTALYFLEQVKVRLWNISYGISSHLFFFLLQVDQFVGKGHLLKRSIILVKAWCYYESRILGAHHGLLSTYALEILVLHIINHFHASLPGPLAVLYRFLDYYSKFDWRTYGVSVFGRVPISSLTKRTADLTRVTEECGLLFGQELVRRNRGSSSSSGIHAEDGTNGFSIKYLNIVDPLKDGNNLGRSVSIGNFHRIKSALSAGAQQLAEILKLPGEIMGTGLEMFFQNTLERNGRGLRADAEVPVPAFGSGRVVPFSLCAEYKSHVSYMQYFPPPLPPQPRPFLPSPMSSIVSEATPLLPHSTSEICFPQNNLAAFAPPVQASGGPYVPMVQNDASGYVPAVPVFQPRPHHMYVGSLPRSRGTGTYIPTLAAYMYGDYLQRSRTRAPFPRTQRQWPRSPRIDVIDVPPEEQESGNNISVSKPENQAARETEKSDVSSEEEHSFDLSLEKFPPLASINKTSSSEAHDNAIGSKDVIPGEGIKFGTLGHFVSRPVPQSGNLTDPTASPVITERQIAIDAEEFQLRNEEFPPLYS